MSWFRTKIRFALSVYISCHRKADAAAAATALEFKVMFFCQPSLPLASPRPQALRSASSPRPSPSTAGPKTAVFHGVSFVLHKLQLPRRVAKDKLVDHRLQLEEAAEGTAILARWSHAQTHPCRFNVEALDILCAAAGRDVLGQLSF